MKNNFMIIVEQKHGWMMKDVTVNDRLFMTNNGQLQTDG